MGKKVSKKNESISVSMLLEKETPNTFRYKQDCAEFERATIQTLYLPKDICKGAEKINVTVDLL